MGVNNAISTIMKKRPEASHIAFLNEDFMNSPDARPMRILSEYIYPRKVLSQAEATDTIVFFGSARAKPLKQIRQYTKDLGNVKLSPKEKKTVENQKQLAQYYRDASALSYKLTKWSKALSEDKERKNKLRKFVICSGGGPGIMEAANRGASLARGKSVALNIALPLEQKSNPYVTQSLDIQFHYFFMRKYWFMYLAKAVVVYPGGFGTCDELFEILTLIQTEKIKKPIPIVLYGSKYWNDVVNLKSFVEWGTISEDDLSLIKIFDKVDETFDYITEEITKHYLK